jgi:hypothetical protein
VPILTQGKTAGAIDRNANSADRQRRNWQKLTQGGVTPYIAVDGVTIEVNSDGQLALVHPLIVNETPGGTINGTNANFSLSMVPFAGTLLVSVDGVLMLEGSDYTLAGKIITFLAGAIPETGDWIRATYEG